MVSDPGALPAAPVPGARRRGGERMHESVNGHVANSSIATSTCT